METDRPFSGLEDRQAFGLTRGSLRLRQKPKNLKKRCWLLVTGYWLKNQGEMGNKKSLHNEKTVGAVREPPLLQAKTKKHLTLEIGAL